MMIVLTVIWALILLFLVFAFAISWVKIEPEKYLILTRTFPFFPPPATGHFIARAFHQGIKAKIYSGGGWHFIPFVQVWTELKQQLLVEIPSGKFGKIEALDGQPLEAGQIVAEKIVKCANFTDGDAFLVGGGQRGTQIILVPPGKWPINEKLFRKTDVDLTVINESQIGMVTLKIGKEIPEESHRNLGIRVDGHNNFQNISPFLIELEKGVQLDVLEPGAYSLNDSVVSVKIIDVPYIENGEVGVVISSSGEEPTDDDLEPVIIDGRGRVGAVLKKNIKKRGILSEVVDPGYAPYTYANNVAYKIITVHTAPVAIDWTEPDESKKHEHPKGSSMRFDPIEVVTNDGFTVPVEAELVVSVSRNDAPKIIAMGGLKEVISNLVVPIFDDLAKTLISKRPLIDLLEKRREVREEIQEEVKKAIQNSYFLTVASFRISEFDFEHSTDPQVGEFVNFMAKTATVQQEVKLIEKQKLVQQVRIELENLRSQADNQNLLVRAGYQKQASTDQSEAIKNRAENLKGLEAIQALIADPEAIPGLVNTLSSLLQGLTGKKS